MKVLTPGKLHWSVEVRCLNLQCQAELEVEEVDFYMGIDTCFDQSIFERGIHFICPECQTPNPVHRGILEEMPNWLYEKAKRQRKEL